MVSCVSGTICMIGGLGVTGKGMIEAEDSVLI